MCAADNDKVLEVDRANSVILNKIDHKEEKENNSINNSEDENISKDNIKNNNDN